MSDHQETLKVALSGGPAKQKTRQIAHLIREVGKENVGILSAEAGLNTIQSVLAGVTVWPVTTSDEVRRVWGEVKKFAEQPGAWIAIDGGTTLLTWYEQDVWKGADDYFSRHASGQPIPDSLKPAARFISPKKQTIDPFSVYAAIGRQVCAWYQEVLRLECNFYINFMEEKIGKSEGEKALPWGFNIPGQVGRDFILAKTDYVGHLYYNAGRQLVCCLDPACSTHQTKTREDREKVAMPAEIVDFDLGAFVRLIRPAVNS